MSHADLPWWRRPTRGHQRMKHFGSGQGELTLSSSQMCRNALTLRLWWGRHYSAQLDLESVSVKKNTGSSSLAWMMT